MGLFFFSVRKVEHVVTCLMAALCNWRGGVGYIFGEAANRAAAAVVKSTNVT